MSTRRIFIGDIQGCRAELEVLLERVHYDPAQDELHPVGDFVNRGPDSTGVLRLMRAEGAGGVLGNHDLHALRVAAGTRELGKRDTLEALLEADDSEELLAWLAQRPFALGWDDVVCVHAGVHPLWKDPLATLAGIDPYLVDARADFATRVRYCAPDGTRPAQDWPPPARPFAPWYEHWRARPGETRTAVFGHWSRAGLVRQPRVRGLDTGCVWGGELTAWIAEEDRIVAVPAQRVWAPVGEES